MKKKIYVLRGTLYDQVELAGCTDTPILQDNSVDILGKWGLVLAVLREVFRHKFAVPFSTKRGIPFSPRTSLCWIWWSWNSRRIRIVCCSALACPIMSQDSRISLPSYRRPESELCRSSSPFRILETGKKILIFPILHVFRFQYFICLWIIFRLFESYDKEKCKFNIYLLT